MQTGEISEKIDRGKHTTRHAELIELYFGGFILDTPGFSSFELADVVLNELEHYYPDFMNYNGQCRFHPCSHINEPDCAIKKAIGEKVIDNDRYQRYIGFYNKIKEFNPYKDKRK